MFFKNFTVYTSYMTQKGAERYIAKRNLDARVEQVGDLYLVVG
jgi:hypothetical protein